LGRFLAAVLISALTATARADMVRILEDGGEAAQVRVDLIQQARREINALYFLARNDRVTMTALALLRDAQRSGVESRLLVDANFHHIPKAVLAHLRDEGVQIREFHPLTPRHPTWTWRRMHEKLVVVDGERYVTGGRNLAESYFGLASKKNYVDRDVFVEGASAADADLHFDALWESKHVRELRTRVSDREKRRAEAMLDAVLASLRCGDGFVKLETGRDWAEGAHHADSVRFLHDPLGKGPRVGSHLNEIFRNAESSIVIESPYLVPGRELRRILQQKRAEGVHVQIVTNSLRSTDGLLPFAGYLKYRRGLVRAGIDVREYKGPDTLHAKSAVVDGRIVLVGSYNIDSRSQNLDLEAMCVAEDEELAQELLSAMQKHVENAAKVDPRRWPRMPRRTLLGLKTMQLLLPLFEGQL
jgi:phosphatidylserine/phosphatidylglycerophosphate/cardiolipin synthase-like enzyme